MYCPADAGIDQHNKVNLLSVPIWASAHDAAVYQHRIKANDQMGEGKAMLVLSENMWLDNLCDLSTNQIRMHQDPEFWLEQHYHDLDITRLKREMSGMAQRYMRGDATRMEAYIKLGSMVYNYNHGNDIFNRSWPSRAIIEGMHEAFFGLPDGDHQEETIQVPKVYMDPIDYILPSGEARDHGPPDWVSGPEGITYTCEDVTITVRTRLPIPEGCLNGDM
jgi:hypothetical protein